MYGVGQQHLVHIRDPSSVLFDHASRHADDGGVGRHVFEHNAPRANLRVRSHGEGTEHFRARAHHNVVFEGGVAFARVLARSAERHALIEHAPVAHFRRFAYHDAAAVVNHYAFAEFCRGVYLDARLSAGAVRDEFCQRNETFEIKPVGNAVGGKRLISRVSVLHGPFRSRGGVLVHHRVQVRALGFADFSQCGNVSFGFSLFSHI